MYVLGEYEFGYTEKYGYRGMDHRINERYEPDRQEFNNCKVNMYWELGNTDHEVCRHESETQELQSELCAP